MQSRHTFQPSYIYGVVRNDIVCKVGAPYWEMGRSSLVLMVIFTNQYGSFAVLKLCCFLHLHQIHHKSERSSTNWADCVAISGYERRTDTKS